MSLLSPPGGYHSLALREDGSVLAWGRDWDGQTDVPPEATTVRLQLPPALAHSVALLADGTVLAWGNNDCGQTNVPPQAQGAVAIAAGLLPQSGLAVRPHRRRLGVAEHGAGFGDEHRGHCRGLVA